MSELNVTKIENEADSSAVEINRKASHGSIVDLQKDGTTLGSITTRAGDVIQISSAGTNSGLDFAGGINPVYSGSLSDNQVDIGYSVYRFKDLYLSGGVYLGGTGSANKLDDYEEGTWTPTLGGTATYLIQSGYYTKIGRLVHYTFELHVNSIGSGSNNRVGGLPVAGNSNRESQGSRGYFASLAKSVTSLLPYVPKGDAGIYFTDTTTAQSTVNLNSVIFQNNARIQASGIYFTA